MKEWRTTTVGDACDILDRLRKPITKKDRISGPYPYYGATGELDKCWVNNHAHVLRPHRSKLLDNWLIYYLNHSDLIPFVTGLTVPKLNQGKLRDIPLPLPPLSEQKRIVGILDEAFAATDAASTNAQQNLTNAKEVFQSQLSAVFMHKGKGWAEKRLAELGKITSSKRIFKREYTNDGIPFFRTKEVKERANGRDITTELFISKDRYNDIKEKYGVPQAGDILLTAIGTIGEVLVVDGQDDFYFKDGNVLWLKDFESVNPYFLRYVLVSFVEGLKRLSHGAAYSALPIERLKQHVVDLPSAVEQQDIVSLLDAIAASASHLESICLRKLDALAELKQSFLERAFSGQL
jgi:type I restriction enzyme, S subunit